MRRLLALSLVASILALTPALLSCTSPEPPAARPAYPAIGTVVTLLDRRVRATGVVAQYPGYGWALYAALGSETASPGVIALMEVHPLEGSVRGLSADSTAGALVAFDGQLVTVEGTMTPVRHLRGGFTRSTRWPVLVLTSIATAPPEAQARVVWEGALVQPGRWFDEPWRYALAQAHETLGRVPGSGYYDLAAAEKAFGSPIPKPTSPVTGRLVGVVLTTYDEGHPPSTWRLVYASGLYVNGPVGGHRGRSAFVASGVEAIHSVLKAYRTRSSHDRRTSVNGRPGLIGEMYGVDVIRHYLRFWDGKQVVEIEYLGLGSGPSDEDLIAIAASMSP